MLSQRDKEAISVPYGLQKVLAKTWGISASSANHWLAGNYRDDQRLSEKRIEFIRAFRDYARRLQEGETYFIACDKNMKAHAFHNRPRRDLFLGEW